MTGSASLSDILHDHGVNLRYLGCVWASLQLQNNASEKLAAVICAEMSARACVNFIGELQRAVGSELGVGSEESVDGRCRLAVSSFLTALASQPTGLLHTDTFVLSDQLASRFHATVNDPTHPSTLFQIM